MPKQTKARKKTKRATKSNRARTRARAASKRKPQRSKAKLQAAGPTGGGVPGANGLPPAPLIVLSEAQTKLRLKAIMAGQSGLSPADIRDNSPIRLPNILLPRLVTAINRHFFPSPLNGIIGFPANEIVIDCARRIKRTRDPQIPQ